MATLGTGNRGELAPHPTLRGYLPVYALRAAYGGCA